MKIKVKSEKTKITRTVTTVLEVGDFNVIDIGIDGKLVDQSWLYPNGGFKNTHPNAYKPENFNFEYFEDISFLKSNSCVDLEDFFDEIPESATLIEDWDNFKGFDHVLCIWLGMDGNIYRIDRAKPISLWRHQNYIAGFDNHDYDLARVMEVLSWEKTWIRNIEIVSIPYYNRWDGRDKAVEFEYRAPSRLAMVKKLNRKYGFNLLT